MLSITTNTSSLIAQNSLKTSTSRLNQAIERMSTGSKINRAKDNAANYSIATNMTTKINALQVAEDNVNMGLDMLGASSEVLSEMETNLAKIRALAVQAQNGSYGSKSLAAMNSEANALMTEISRLNETAQYNGIKLFNTGKDEVTNAGKELKLNEQGFLQEVVVRDTSTMTKLSSVDETQALAQGTYSISTKEELIQMATMIKNKLVANNTEFVLAADIDLKGVQWESTSFSSGTFDGNGHTISNLTGTNGLFKDAQMVKNVRLENVNISGSSQYTGAIAGTANATNCTVTGKIKSTSHYTGGVIGGNYYRTTKYCYADVEVSGTTYVGGIIGSLNYASAHYCVSKGKVTGNSNVGGVAGGWNDVYNSASYATVIGKTSVGGIIGSVNRSLSGNYFAGIVSGEKYVGGLVGNHYSTDTLTNNIIEGSIYGEEKVGIFTGSSKDNNKITKSYYYKKNTSDIPLVGAGNDVKIEAIDITIPTEYSLQVGTSADSTRSSITLTTYVDFSALSEILKTGIEDKTLLEKVDTLINQVGLKQTEIGTAQNRLTSVLDEISTQYENLLSSRSTIQDADMSEVSSEYLKMQILQQASATLMATANQTPSIALQLL